MCGIVGFTGHRQAAPILLEGLKKLEYRGYDSAGIAVRNGEELAQVVKATGKLKNLSEKTDGGSALVGTEESGGLGYRKHIPERDGVLSGLLFTEALIGLGFKNAGEAVAYIDKEFGKLRYHRIDKECDPNAKDAFMKKLESEPPKEILGRKVVNIKTIDGVKFELEDDSWLLLRFSGTEPVCRFYAEAPTLEEAEKMTELGASLLK